jgi:hypothetical protein
VSLRYLSAAQRYTAERSVPCVAFQQEEPQRPDAGQGSGPRAALTPDASPARGSLPQRPDPRHTARQYKTVRPTAERSDLRGAGGHAAPALHASPRPQRVRPARAPPVPRSAQGLRPRSASIEARLARPPACAGGQSVVAVLLVHAARPGLDAGALRQYIAKSVKERKSPQRDNGRSGEAADLQERQAIRRAPGGGVGARRIRGTGRAQRRRCLPLEPPGGRVGMVRRSVRVSALPRQRGAGMSPGSPAQGGGSGAAKQLFSVAARTGPPIAVQPGRTSSTMRARAPAACPSALPGGDPPRTGEDGPVPPPGQTTVVLAAPGHAAVVIHMRWGKPCALAGEGVRLQGLGDGACWGSRGRRRGKDRPV